MLARAVRWIAAAAEEAGRGDPRRRPKKRSADADAAGHLEAGGGLIRPSSRQRSRRRRTCIVTEHTPWVSCSGAHVEQKQSREAPRGQILDLLQEAELRCIWGSVLCRASTMGFVHSQPDQRDLGPKRGAQVSVLDDVPFFWLHFWPKSRCSRSRHDPPDRVTTRKSAPWPRSEPKTQDSAQIRASSAPVRAQIRQVELHADCGRPPSSTSYTHLL